MTDLFIDLRNAGIYLEMARGGGKVVEVKAKKDELIVLTIQPLDGKPVYNRLLTAAHKDGSLSDNDRSYIEDTLFRYGCHIVSTKAALANRLARALRKKKKKRSRRVKRRPRDFRPKMPDEDESVAQADNQIPWTYLFDPGPLRARLLEDKLKRFNCS